MYCTTGEKDLKYDTQLGHNHENILRTYNVSSLVKYLRTWSWQNCEVIFKTFTWLYSKAHTRYDSGREIVSSHRPLPDYKQVTRE